jgi:polyisoprenoid-binding protein YceI
MRTPLTSKIKYLFVALITTLPAIHYGQQMAAVRITVEGTSNIHDWTMQADKGSGNAAITLGPNNTLTSLGNLSFSMAAESLKSEHKAMDKNTYKALNTDKNPTISFAAPTSNIKATGGNSFSVVTHGKLTISGVSKNTDLAAACTVNADKSVTCTGAYKLKMSQFNVEPPSIMFGTITVGDDITVKYTVTYK